MKRLVDRLMESSGEKERINPDVAVSGTIASAITYLRTVDMECLQRIRRMCNVNPNDRLPTMSFNHIGRGGIDAVFPSDKPDYVFLRKGKGYSVAMECKTFMFAVDMMYETLDVEGREDETLD